MLHLEPLSLKDAEANVAGKASPDAAAAWVADHKVALEKAFNTIDRSSRWVPWSPCEGVTCAWSLPVPG